VSVDQQLSQPIYDVEQRDDVAIPMRDGTVMRADVYVPVGLDIAPALIERTPYNKKSSSEIQVNAPSYFASRGYAVVIQDVRGRFASDGEFYPFRDDGWGLFRDGYDTVEWVAAQEWCDGKVGTIGGSYSGATQYRLAPTRPPHLVAQFVRESSSDYHEEWVYRGGAMELGFSLNWALGVTLSNLPHLVDKEHLDNARSTIKSAVDEFATWARHLPLHPMPPITGLSDWFNEWLLHPDDGPYWWQWNVAQRHRDIDVPIYHLGAWFDCFLRGTLENFIGITRHGRSENTRKNQKLIVGPWIHGPQNVAVSKVGEFEFGPDAALALNDLRLAWFDYWLKGIETGIMDEPPVRYFTMGANRWQTASAWPPPDARSLVMYLRNSKPDGAGTGAASLNDGGLTLEAPGASEAPAGYVANPHDPIPVLGGGWLGSPNGPYDQRPIEARLLTYTSAPLKANVEVTGHVTATLFAMTTATDTDWVVRLSDVSPDGVSRLVADGVLRARYRHSRAKPELLRPHQVERFDVDLWATSNLFQAGHRIRVAVASSCFPRWDANLQTGGPFAHEAVGQVASNTVFHDAFRPSHITLSVRGGEGRV
jgi:putative CocE/NonD family hydrolase